MRQSSSKRQLSRGGKVSEPGNLISRNYLGSTILQKFSHNFFMFDRVILKIALMSEYLNYQIAYLIIEMIEYLNYSRNSLE
jgi:hypothetical protein